MTRVKKVMDGGLDGVGKVRLVFLVKNEETATTLVFSMDR